MKFLAVIILLFLPNYAYALTLEPGEPVIIKIRANVVNSCEDEHCDLYQEYEDAEQPVDEIDYRPMLEIWRGHENLTNETEGVRP